jgi:DNA-binding response OmpR family regulator
MQKTICIIEDNTSIRNLFSLLFKKKGFETIDFEKGNDALIWLSSNKPEAIMCDIMLPDINGNQILEKVRKMPDGKSIPVIVVTGFANNNDREKYLEQGFDGYISKPINVSTFVADVEGIIGRMKN